MSKTEVEGAYPSAVEAEMEVIRSHAEIDRLKARVHVLEVALATVTGGLKIVEGVLNRSGHLVWGSSCPVTRLPHEMRVGDADEGRRS